MKKLKLLIALVSLACVLAVVAFASADMLVTYDMVDSEFADGVYEVVTNIKSGSGVLGYSQVFTFNNQKLKLVEGENLTVVNDAANYADKNAFLYTYSYKSGTKTYEYDTSRDVIVTTSGNSTTITVDLYTTNNGKFPYSDFDICSILFAFADGYTTEDIMPSDFVVDSIACGNVTTNYGYRYGTSSYTEIDFVNNVPVQVSTITIPVTEGDIIYLADGSTAVADATGNYEVDAIPGIIVVNTGYTAQKVYEVADGEATERTDLRNAVLGSNQTSIRGNGGRIENRAGIRFLGDFSRNLKNISDVVDYGFIGTATSTSNELPEGYVLNSDLVDSGKAVKCQVYWGNGHDGVYNYDEGLRRIVTVVYYGMPLTSENVNTSIIVRPYVKLSSGDYIYGEPYASTTYEVASAMSGQAEPYMDVLTNAQAYIEEVLGIGDGEVIIDVSPLFD